MSDAAPAARGSSSSGVALIRAFGDSRVTDVTTPVQTTGHSESPM